MENKVNVKEFVEKYEACKNSAAKEKMIKEIISTEYIGFNYKTVVANKIVQASCMDEDGNVSVNSVGRHLLRIKAILQLYTNIDINSENMLDVYDVLMEKNIFMNIINAIPEREIIEFDTIIKMTLDDFMTNHYEIHGFITSCLNGISKALDASMPQLAEIIDSVNKKE